MKFFEDVNGTVDVSRVVVSMLSFACVYGFVMALWSLPNIGSERSSRALWRMFGCAIGFLLLRDLGGQL